MFLSKTCKIRQNLKRLHKNLCKNDSNTLLNVVEIILTDVFGVSPLPSNNFNL